MGLRLRCVSFPPQETFQEMDVIVAIKRGKQAQLSSSNVSRYTAGRKYFIAQTKSIDYEMSEQFRSR